MASELISKRIRPFYGRIAVVESPVDEEETKTGIVLPLHEEKEAGLKRGVVQSVDKIYDDPDYERIYEKVAPGTVVWFKRGTRIRDVVILDPADVYAFETDP